MIWQEFNKKRDLDKIKEHDFIGKTWNVIFKNCVTEFYIENNSLKKIGPLVTSALDSHPSRLVLEPALIPGRAPPP